MQEEIRSIIFSSYHTVVAYNVAMLIRQPQQFHFTISKTEAFRQQSLDCHAPTVKHSPSHTETALLMKNDIRMKNH